MKQKFPIGTFVRVCKDMPIHMSYFEKDFIGIVEGTYKQLCGGDNNIKDYALIYLDDNGVPIMSIAWYEEDQLTLVSTDTKKGKILIGQFKNEN